MSENNVKWKDEHKALFSKVQRSFLLQKQSEEESPIYHQESSLFVFCTCNRKGPHTRDGITGIY